MGGGWVAVSFVIALLLLFIRQFCIELRTYGLYLNSNNDNAAKDYFFSSLTGAVVYGHGNVSVRRGE